MPVPAFLSSILTSVVTSAIDGAIENVINAPLAPPDPTVAFARPFPEEAKKGEMEPPLVLGQLTISGKVFTRSPAMLIRNQQNMIVLPTSIQSSVPVRYQVDAMGAVYRVWLLSANEAAAP